MFGDCFKNTFLIRSNIENRLSSVLSFLTRLNSAFSLRFSDFVRTHRLVYACWEYRSTVYSVGCTRAPGIASLGFLQ